MAAIPNDDILLPEVEDANIVTRSSTRVTVETLGAFERQFQEIGGEGYATRVSKWINDLKFPPGLSKAQVLAARSSGSRASETTSIARQFCLNRPIYLKILDCFAMLMLCVERQLGKQVLYVEPLFTHLQQILEYSNHYLSNPAKRKYIAYNSAYFKNNILPEYERLFRWSGQLYENVRQAQREKFIVGMDVPETVQCVKWDKIFGKYTECDAGDDDMCAFVVGGVLMSKGRKDFMIDEDEDTLNKKYFTSSEFFTLMDNLSDYTHLLPFQTCSEYIQRGQTITQQQLSDLVLFELKKKTNFDYVTTRMFKSIVLFLVLPMINEILSLVRGPQETNVFIFANNLQSALEGPSSSSMQYFKKEHIMNLIVDRNVPETQYTYSLREMPQGVYEHGGQAEFCIGIIFKISWRYILAFKRFIGQVRSLPDGLRLQYKNRSLKPLAQDFIDSFNETVAQDSFEFLTTHVLLKTKLEPLEKLLDAYQNKYRIVNDSDVEFVLRTKVRQELGYLENSRNMKNSMGIDNGNVVRKEFTRNLQRQLQITNAYQDEFAKIIQASPATITGRFILSFAPNDTKENLERDFIALELLVVRLTVLEKWLSDSVDKTIKRRTSALKHDLEVVDEMIARDDKIKYIKKKLLEDFPLNVDAIIRKIFNIYFSSGLSLLYFTPDGH